VHRSEFDLLTDIHNRFSLETALGGLIEVARGAGTVFGLIYLDLNEFKGVNDRYGHRCGDAYLKKVTARMQGQLRPEDTLARVGGDEFAVLAPRVRCRGEAEEIALRLERCYDDPFAVDGNIIRGSASIGLALYPEDGTTKDALLNAADAAMYVEKRMKQGGCHPAPDDTASANHASDWITGISARSSSSRSGAPGATLMPWKRFHSSENSRVSPGHTVRRGPMSSTSWKAPST
jgi:diguanylate cyclase (GGDEF)-like protein